MAHDASELGERVWHERMRPERLGLHVREAGLFQSQVAGAATIDNTYVRQPCLLQAGMETALERDRLAATANQRKVVALIAGPLAEVILCGRHRQACEQNCA
jgi:hypothetical protein